MGLLEECPSPVVAVQSVDLLQSIFTLPKDEFKSSDILDKRVCSALLKKPAVMTPLLRFLLVNATETPVSDQELAAIRAMPVIECLLCSSDKKELTTAGHCSLPPGR